MQVKFNTLMLQPGDVHITRSRNFSFSVQLHTMEFCNGSIAYSLETMQCKLFEEALNQQYVLAGFSNVDLVFNIYN